MKKFVKNALLSAIVGVVCNCDAVRFAPYDSIYLVKSEVQEGVVDVSPITSLGSDSLFHGYGHGDYCKAMSLPEVSRTTMPKGTVMENGSLLDTVVTCSGRFTIRPTVVSFHALMLADLTIEVPPMCQELHLWPISEGKPFFLDGKINAKEGQLSLKIFDAQVEIKSLCKICVPS
ncbi:MAG: hypothetical protein LBJ89_01160 [Holosporales bacterium]|jgi:hypothetical protein|nr:hypothetical protein [Holosporales bacterium]